MNRNSKERQAKIMDLLKEQEVVKTKELMEQILPDRFRGGLE